MEFSMENFRSVENKATLSLLATSDKLLPDNVIEAEALKKNRVLKSAAISGANASGKTNIIMGFFILRNLVLRSHKNQKGDALPYTPFEFNEKNPTLPTRFKITFMKNDIKYIYDLSYDKERISEELLYYYPKGRRSIIFERRETDQYNFTKDKRTQNSIRKKTPKNVLYLSRATQFNYERAIDPFDWFKDDLWVIGPTDHPGLIDETFDLMQQSDEYKKMILKAIHSADMGIDDISTEAEQKEFDEIPRTLPAEFLPPEVRKKVMMGEKVKILAERRSIITDHNGHSLNFFQESEGTRRFFSLIGPWLKSLKDGKILIVDELDTKLHHLLNEYLISLFHDPSQNKTNSQLIFTTHNLNLLNREIFRRDQVWFTEKDPETESTELYSLIEYRPRNDKNYLNGYLAGRYGGLPYIKSYKVF